MPKRVDTMPSPPRRGKGASKYDQFLNGEVWHFEEHEFYNGGWPSVTDLRNSIYSRATKTLGLGLRTRAPVGDGLYVQSYEKKGDV